MYSRLSSLSIPDCPAIAADEYNSFKSIAIFFSVISFSRFFLYSFASVSSLKSNCFLTSANALSLSIAFFIAGNIRAVAEAPTFIACPDLVDSDLLNSFRFSLP